MKHTPGPWINLGNGDIIARSENYCGGEKDIASVFLTSNDEDEWNAQLIAAAPDLLEALRGALEHWPVPSSICKDRPAWKAARAAIALATGSQP